MNRKLIAIRLLAVFTFVVALASAPGAPAGNVQVSVENGNLIIQGDSHDNNIILVESGIAGRAGTTVNGQRFMFIPEGVSNDIEINLKGGDDFVRVELPGTNFAIPHDLEINTGAGNDIIELLQVKAPNETRLDTASG